MNTGRWKSETKLYTVIPDRDVVRLPLEPHLKVVVLADLREEKREYRVGLGFRHAYYAPREACSRASKVKRCCGCVATTTVVCGWLSNMGVSERERVSTHQG